MRFVGIGDSGRKFFRGDDLGIFHVFKTGASPNQWKVCFERAAEGTVKGLSIDIGDKTLLVFLGREKNRFRSDGRVGQVGAINFDAEVFVNKQHARIVGIIKLEKAVAKERVESHTGRAVIAAPSSLCARV